MAAKKKKKKQSSPILKYLKIVGVILILGVVGVLAYSAFIFESSEQEEEGFFICNPENTRCELSRHVHAEIELSICGEAVSLEREEGRTDEQHTHKERDRIHWHDQIAVDPQTREALDPTRVQLGAFLEQLDIEFPETCPNNPSPELSVVVNGVEAEEGLEYVWVDDDVFSVEYK